MERYPRHLGTNAGSFVDFVVNGTKIQRIDGEVKYIDDNGEWTATPTQLR